jgi:DNA-binding response OmpR family regulator
VSEREIRVLVVEDEAELARCIFEFLEPQGYVLDHAADGLTGLHLAAVNHYDILLLDVNLPGVNGFDICQRLREDAKQTTPILMMTARDTLSDKLNGFDKGADDYLVKPFDLPELEVRIRKLVGRVSRQAKLLNVGSLSFNVGQLQAERDGKKLALSRIGERLLEKLMRSYPDVVQKRELEAVVWGEEPPEADSLRSHIYSLRRAIDEGSDHKMLTTVHRLGYRLVAEGDD